MVPLVLVTVSPDRVRAPPASTSSRFELVKLVSLSMALPVPLTSVVPVLLKAPPWMVSPPVRSSTPLLVTMPLLTVVLSSVS